MRNTSVWQRLLGLTRTVVEDVDLDEAADVLVVSVRPRQGRPSALRALRSRAGSMTGAKAAGGGGLSMSGSCGASSRPKRPG